MKTNLLLIGLTAGLMLPAVNAAAQSPTSVVVEDVSVTEIAANCKTNYSTTWRDNWFLQLGAGAQTPLVEYGKVNGGHKLHFTMNYNLGLGRWFSPYLGWRLDLNYGNMRWDNMKTSTAKLANANVDIMWDMFNSLGGVNSSRVFSIVPFVGVGGTFVWDYDNLVDAIYQKPHQYKRNQWLLPVSAGMQFRFRLCKYADFFLEARAYLYGDNFNNYAWGRPIDINIQALGGFNINFGGRDFTEYNPCDYLGYIADLNNQVNSLRGDLAATTCALAAAEAQLPCPEVAPVVNQTYTPAPMLSAVRFTINSAVVTPEEMVNVYNVAQWMKDNPDVNVVIKGYADKDTGTSAYNMQLSERRANAVADLLTKNYGISRSRLSIEANGSDTQVYPENNWNRIVIFSQPTK